MKSFRDLEGVPPGQLIERALQTHRIPVLILFSAVYFAGMLLESRRKLAWLDEAIFISIAKFLP